MKRVEVRRCSSCATIRAHADRFAEALRGDPRFGVSVVDGLPNEFRVFVDGGEVSVHSGESLLEPERLAAMLGGGEFYVESYPASTGSRLRHQ
jgi:hypothetical protein